MKGQNLLIGAASAAGVFAVTLAVLAPANLNATEPATPARAALQGDTPLVVDGVQIVLKHPDDGQSAEATALKPGDPLKFKLVARNTLDESTEIEATITVQEMSMGSMLSRRLPTPTEAWKGRQSIALSGGETRTIEISPEVRAKAGSLLTVQVSFGENRSRALTFGMAIDDSLEQLRNGR